jgi:hypothetical protein
VGVALINADRRTDGRTDIEKLKGAFRDLCKRAYNFLVL